jgi:putative DNA primase/helicase
MLTPEQTTAAATALREAGLLADSVEFDGVLHRCGTVDKPHSKNGAYIAHSDAPASLWWQDWASGESGVWTATGQSQMTTAEREAFARRMDESRKAREAEQARAHAEAAAKARRIYDAAKDCAGHVYLTAKKVRPSPGQALL